MGQIERPSISVSRRGDARGDDDCTVVWLHGDHDLASRASVTGAIDLAADLERVDVLVDLSLVTFLDASIIGALVEARNHLRARRLTLDLRAPSHPARRVIEVCGLTHLVRAPKMQGQLAGFTTMLGDRPRHAAAPLHGDLLSAAGVDADRVGP